MEESGGAAGAEDDAAEGWEVDPGELEFIRGAHRMQAERVDLDGEVEEEKEKVAIEKYEVFLKQYEEWVEANRDRLEEESCKLNNKLKKEAEARGAEFKVDKLRRNIEMDEYDLMHWRRSLEEKEALIRYISCRKALGLPVEERGRYDIDTAFSKAATTQQIPSTSKQIPCTAMITRESPGTRRRADRIE